MTDIILKIILPLVVCVLSSWAGYLVFRTKQNAQNESVESSLKRMEKEINANDVRLRRELNDSENRKDEAVARAFKRIEVLESSDRETRSHIAESMANIASLLKHASATDQKLDTLLTKMVELTASMNRNS